jgi:major membrane immunogen (membrane-anchored lipoprotein)
MVNVMKKAFGILAVIAVGTLLTGCGKADKLTCTREQDFGKAKIKITTVATFDKGYLKEEATELKGEFESDEMAKSYYDNFKDKENYTAKQDGTTVTVKYKTPVDDATKNADENKKDNYKEYMEQAGNTCE